VLELRDAIFQHVAVHKTGSNTVSLAAACRMSVRDTSEILRTVIRGGLRTATVPPDCDRRVDKIRFDRFEISEVFLRPAQTFDEVEGLKVLRQRETAGYLSVKGPTVPYLIKLGLLETIAVENPVNRRKQLVVTRASIDKFKREYISVFDVAQHYDTHTNVVLEAFRRVGIAPIYDECGSTVSRFFRRSDIDEVALDIRRRPRRSRKRVPRPA
jgi:hypothetical protein